MTYLSLWVDDPLMVLNAAMRPWTVMRKKRRWRRFVTSILFSTFFFSLLATISLLPWLMFAILDSLVTCFSSLSLPVSITFTSCVYHFHFLFIPWAFCLSPVPFSSSSLSLLFSLFCCSIFTFSLVSCHSPTHAAYACISLLGLLLFLDRMKMTALWWRARRSWIQMTPRPS